MSTLWVSSKFSQWCVRYFANMTDAFKHPNQISTSLFFPSSIIVLTYQWIAQQGEECWCSGKVRNLYWGLKKCHKLAICSVLKNRNLLTVHQNNNRSLFPKIQRLQQAARHMVSFMVIIPPGVTSHFITLIHLIADPSDPHTLRGVWHENTSVLVTHAFLCVWHLGLY